MRFCLCQYNSLSCVMFCLLHQQVALTVLHLLVLRVLQSEYRRLKWKHEEAASVPMLTEAGEGGLGSPTAGGQQDEELLAEARVLRQHKTRLETRMQILEDHNKQLESQLRRLRELLLQVSGTPLRETWKGNEQYLQWILFI